MSYAHAQYAQSLQGFGTPRLLPGCGGWVIQRPVPGKSGLSDAMGCYPLFSCAEWAGLQDDLEALRREGLASLVLVADPLTRPPADLLTWLFDGVCRPWKTHYLVDLKPGMGSLGNTHHRRNVRRFLSHGHIEICEDPSSHLDDWCALYAHLIKRHGITGPARFSREGFKLQLGLPGVVLARAVNEHGEVVGMMWWFTDGPRAWYHLAGYTPAGYRRGGASSALTLTVLEHLGRSGVTVADLGAGAGLADDPDDGLTRFKAGWATRTSRAWLCGSILDRSAYASLSRGETQYFPAYRDPAMLAMSEATHVHVG